MTHAYMRWTSGVRKPKPPRPRPKPKNPKGKK